MTAFLIIGLIAESLALVGCLYWWRVGAARAQQLAEEKVEMQRRLDEARSEVSEAKEEARKRRGELVEARDQLRKAKRKRGRNSEDSGSEAASGNDENPELERLRGELKRLTAALEGAEVRVQRVQGETDAAVEQARDKVRAEIRRELEGQLTELRQQVDTLTADLDRARRSGEKATAEATPSDVRIDLKTLAPEVVGELRRFYKRATNYEKLYAITRGKLEAIGDKHEEMQRRYFAVCRELAVAAGRKLASGQGGDEAAARVAQEIVSGAEAAVRQRQRKPRPRRAPKTDKAASETSATATDGSAALPVDAPTVDPPPVADASKEVEPSAEPAAQEA